MIKKLKLKFIALSMISLFVLLALVVVGMNTVNYLSFVSESDEVLSVISRNRGKFPGNDMHDQDNEIHSPGNGMYAPDNGMYAPGNEMHDPDDEMHSTDNEMHNPDDEMHNPNDEMHGSNNGDKGDAFLPPHMSPETPHESRYFTVLLDKTNTIVQIDTSKVVTVSKEDAKEYAQSVISKGTASGFADDFRYLKTSNEFGIRLTFLDCGRKLDAIGTFAISSVGFSLLGYVIIFAVVVFFSGRIIRPVAESYEKQKRFITDAGHEIKTPLTIINANADLAEMELGEDESLSEIKKQTKRLTELTNSLVYLAKMEESGDKLQKIDFSISDTVNETANSFRAPAQLGEKSIFCDTEPLITVCGNESAIRQLISILLDNAVKYSTGGSKINVLLKKQNRQVVLTVSNTPLTPLSRKNLDQMFERFYRADPSRNSETGGHGVGLSIARAIVEAHGGKIHAVMQNSTELIITVTLPL